MRNKAARDALCRLLTRARYEVLPTPSCEDLVLEHVPPGFTVTVTASPGRGLDSTLTLAERLAASGYRAVPHLAARMVSGRAELQEISDRLLASGIGTVFVPAGDADPPAGAYSASIDLLRDLAEIGSPFAEVGVTGYPESHPTIHDDLTVQAMWDKRLYATHIVSNMTFDPATLTGWVRRVRQRGVTLPLLVGVPGPVDRAKLVAMSTKIGIGESARFLVKHRRTLTRLAAPGGFTGESFLQRLGPTLASADAVVTGLHVFTFNQLAATEQWRQDLLRRLGNPAQVG